MTDRDYEIGEMQARLDTGDERHSANIKHLEQIDTTLKGLVEAITLMKGGARALYWVGAIGVALGAAVSSAFHWLTEHIK